MREDEDHDYLKKNKVSKEDVVIGQKLRQKRSSLGLTQDRIAKFLEISPQQVQKYERGLNRISGSKLWKLANFLGVQIDYFFDKITSSAQTFHTNHHDDILEHNEEYTSFAEAQHPFEGEGGSGVYLSDKEVLSLVKSFNKIKSPKVRSNIMKLVDSLAG